MYRAQATCTNLAKDMRVKVANGDIFETDMNLRVEKEKQRAALIKLREISSVDPGTQTKLGVNPINLYWHQLHQKFPN